MRCLLFAVAVVVVAAAVVVLDHFDFVVIAVASDGHCGSFHCRYLYCLHHYWPMASLDRKILQ